MSKVFRNISIFNLMQYKFPLTAIVSIFHRVTGVVLFLFIPYMLWALEQSLASPSSFAHLKTTLMTSPARCFYWIFLAALSYHFVAGFKHLMMDHGFFETKCSGKAASMMVILLSACLMIAWGVVLW